MFVASVLAYCTGICLQAFHPLPLVYTFLVALGLAATLPFLVSRHKVFSLIVIVCFMLSGALRLGLVSTGNILPTLPDEAGENDIYEGTVVESSSRSKILALTRPEKLKGMRVALLSPLNLETSQVVRLFGKIRELRPSFKNPGTMSWKWLKRLEGVSYEIKGVVLSATNGRDPVARIRRYFKQNIENSGAPHADILKALTIGDRASIPEDKNNLFLRTGTSHVLAISGFNVGIISGFFFFLSRGGLRRIRYLRISGRDTRYASLLTIPFPFLFMLVAGAGVSVVRATIMIAVFMAALFLERERHFYNTLALAALIILLLYPHSLFAPSFQLTFMSLLFIVMFMEKLFPFMIKIRNSLLRWSVSTVLSTAAATLGTAPIVIYYFYGINPFCVFHNLITIPLIGVGATTLSLIGMTFPAAHHLLAFAGTIVEINIRLLRSVDFGYLYPVIRPFFSEVLIYYALVPALLYVSHRRVAGILFFVLIPLAAVQAYSDYRLRYNDDLRVHFIDVGLGDATLIEAPGGKRILIDGGGYPRSDFDMGKHVITPFLLYRKVGHIDYLINTHPHTDHIGGLIHVLKHFTVSHVVTSGYFPKERNFRELMTIARSKGVPHLVWKRGDGLQTRNFTLDVLHPGKHMPLNDLNNSSLVFRLRHGDLSFLLPADIQSDIEEELVLSGVPLKSDVVRLAHHGSAFSNSFAFIYAVNPKLAVLSTSSGTVKNLPSPVALQRYRELSIPVLRTDRNGLIEICSDGKSLKWSVYEK